MFPSPSPCCAALHAILQTYFSAWVGGSTVVLGFAIDIRISLFLCLKYYFFSLKIELMVNRFHLVHMGGIMNIFMQI